MPIADHYRDSHGAVPDRSRDSLAADQHRDRYGAVSRDRSLSLAVRIGDAPGAGLVPGCEAFDTNADGRIDLADFARLQRLLTAE